jgi:hypothetical protein
MVCQTGDSLNPFEPSGFTNQWVLNNNPASWLYGARPPPLGLNRSSGNQMNTHTHAGVSDYH